MKNIFRRMLTGGALLVAVAGFASADTVFSTSAVVTFATDNSYTLTLNKFNPSLGTLTGATIFFKGVEDLSSITFNNTGSTTQSNFDVSATSNLILNFANSATAADKFTGGGQTLDLFDTVGGAAQLPTTPGSLTLGGFTGVTINCPVATPSASCNTVAYTPPDEIVANTDAIYGLTTGTGAGGVFGVTKTATVLSNYTGAGTFNLTGTTKSFTGFSGGGNNIGFNINTQATFQAEIDYTYTPPSTTPEPATMVLFGSALVGLGLLRKRVRS